MHVKSVVDRLNSLLPAFKGGFSRLRALSEPSDGGRHHRRCGGGGGQQRRVEGSGRRLSKVDFHRHRSDGHEHDGVEQQAHPGAGLQFDGARREAPVLQPLGHLVAQDLVDKL